MKSAGKLNCISHPLDSLLMWNTEQISFDKAESQLCEISLSGHQRYLRSTEAIRSTLHQRDHWSGQTRRILQPSCYGGVSLTTSRPVPGGGEVSICHSSWWNVTIQPPFLSFSFINFISSSCIETTSNHPPKLLVHRVQETLHFLNVNCCSWVNVIPSRLLLPASNLQECPGSPKGQRLTCPGARGLTWGSCWGQDEECVCEECVAVCLCAPFGSSWHLQSNSQVHMTRVCVPKTCECTYCMVPNTTLSDYLSLSLSQTHTHKRTSTDDKHMLFLLPLLWRCDGEVLGQSQTDGPRSWDSISVTETNNWPHTHTSTD